MPTGLKSSPDDFDLRMSEEARPFYDKVVDFLEAIVRLAYHFKREDSDEGLQYSVTEVIRLQFDDVLKQ